MLRSLMRLVPVPALVVAVLVAGCADQTGLEPDLLSPESAQLARGGKDKQAKAEKKQENRDRKDKAREKEGREEKRVREKRRDGGSKEWKAVRGKLDTKRGVDLKAHARVDGSKDAFLYAHGHALRIPAGAVSEPTVFALETFKKDLGDGTVIVGVELTATVRRGGVDVSVGPLGFLKPLTLYISADYVVEGTDLTDAEILWLTSDDTVEPVADASGMRKLTTRWGDVFTVDLDHFSKYILGTPW